MNLFDKILYGGTSRLTPLEQSLFGTLLTECASDLSDVFGLQLKNIRLIQKFHNRSVIGYHLNRGFDVLLPGRRWDLTFCEFRYKLSGMDKRSRLVISAGAISSLETKGGLSKAELKMRPEGCRCTLLVKEMKTLMDEYDEEEHVEE